MNTYTRLMLLGCLIVGNVAVATDNSKPTNESDTQALAESLKIRPVHNCKEMLAAMIREDKLIIAQCHRGVSFQYAMLRGGFKKGNDDASVAFDQWNDSSITHIVAQNDLRGASLTLAGLSDSSLALQSKTESELLKALLIVRTEFIQSRSSKVGLIHQVYCDVMNQSVESLLEHSAELSKIVPPRDLKKEVSDTSLSLLLESLASMNGPLAKLADDGRSGTKYSDTLGIVLLRAEALSSDSSGGAGAGSAAGSATS